MLMTCPLACSMTRVFCLSPRGSCCNLADLRSLMPLDTAAIAILTQAVQATYTDFGRDDCPNNLAYFWQQRPLKFAVKCSRSSSYCMVVIENVFPRFADTNADPSVTGLDV